MWGGTFHHMANRILRRTAHLIGYSNDFTIRTPMTAGHSCVNV